MDLLDLDQSTASQSACTRTLPYGYEALTFKAPGPRRDMDILEAIAAGRSRSERLTSLLHAAYRTPGEEQSDLTHLALLDRQAALFRLALATGQWPALFVVVCRACGDLVDLRIKREEFGCSPAHRCQQDPSSMQIEGADGIGRRVLLPNGYHERQLEDFGPTNEPDQLLKLLCSDLPEPMSGEATAAWLQAFEKGLAAHSPALNTELMFDCPHCHESTNFWFDPLDWILRHVGAVLQTVHRLASAYGWSEHDILAMSAPRQRAYLALLEEAS